MHWVIKMAFLLFYLRFATAKIFRNLVYCTMALNTLSAVSTWTIYCLQCIPLDAYFHPELHPTVKCLDKSILAFVPAAFVSHLLHSMGKWELTRTERLHRYPHRRATHPSTLEDPSQSPQTPYAHQHCQSGRNCGPHLLSPHDRAPRVPTRNRFHLHAREAHHHLLHRNRRRNNSRQRAQSKDILVSLHQPFDENKDKHWIWDDREQTFGFIEPQETNYGFAGQLSGYE